MTPPDDAWLRPLAKRLRRELRVVAREPLTGGFTSDGAERVDLDDGTSVVLKRSGPREIAALRAVAAVNGPVRAPRMLASGDGWVLLAHEPGGALPAGSAVPDDVWRTLALVHAHWRKNRPRGIPIVDDGWWARLCAHAAERLDAAADRAAPPKDTEQPTDTEQPAATALRDDARSVRSWAADRRVTTALSVLPRTLCHGDAHRGNVHTGAGAVLLDWGNARVAPGSLDTVVLAAPSTDGPADAPSDPVPDLYRNHLHEALGAPDPPAMIAAENAWARAQAHVQYLPFSADHLGPERVASMVRVASAALTELGSVLGR